jgi:hypothetical protein
VTQKESDAGYGTVALTLAAGTYQIVVIAHNQVTRYTGSFFGSGGGGSTSDGTFRLTADPEWDSVNGYTF